MYVLDSSILIELFQAGPLTSTIEDFLKDALPVTTSVCMHEVLVGARNAKEWFIFENLLAQMQILDHNSYSAKVGAKLRQELSKSGVSLAPFDTLIAGICKANNAELVTLDHDFAKIKGFKAVILGKRKA